MPRSVWPHQASLWLVNPPLRCPRGPSSPLLIHEIWGFGAAEQCRKTLLGFVSLKRQAAKGSLGEAVGGHRRGWPKGRGGLGARRVAQVSKAEGGCRGEVFACVFVLTKRFGSAKPLRSQPIGCVSFFGEVPPFGYGYTVWLDI